MLKWHHKKVNRRFGVDVFKRQRGLSARDNFGWDLTSDDGAKQAISHAQMLVRKSANLWAFGQAPTMWQPWLGPTTRDSA